MTPGILTLSIMTSHLYNDTKHYNAQHTDFTMAFQNNSNLADYAEYHGNIQASHL
jgi:hypothetical protein